MPAWMETLAKEASAIDLETISEPSTEVENGDRVIGELDEDLKRLLGLAEKYGRLHRDARRKAFIEFKAKVSENSSLEGLMKVYQETMAEANAYDTRHDAIMEVFWATAREALGVWEAQGLGIRKGWKLVEIKNELDPHEFLSSVLAGPGFPFPSGMIVVEVRRR